MRSARFLFHEGGPIRSVDHFLVELKPFAGSAGNHQVYFRGHGLPVPSLVPSIGRNHAYLGRSRCFNRQDEDRLLSRFRRHAYEHLGRVPNLWETLFLARHYGLPTRLLDWTSNPLVALYFAAFYESENLVPDGSSANKTAAKLELDGTVWAIKSRENMKELNLFTKKRSPLRIPGIKLVFPFASHETTDRTGGHVYASWRPFP